MPALRTVKNLKGPQLLHVITTKGKGYAPAEPTRSNTTRSARSIRGAGW